MEDNLITILESFGYPVYRQGSMSADATYPETFMTFWNNNSPNHAHYDNNEFGTVWDFNIFVYSSDPAVAYLLLAEVRAALKQNHWITPSKGFDVASDEPTHIGRALNIYFLET